MPIATNGATPTEVTRWDCLLRHSQGDWGSPQAAKAEPPLASVVLRGFCVFAILTFGEPLFYYMSFAEKNNSCMSCDTHCNSSSIDSSVGGDFCNSKANFMLRSMHPTGNSSRMALHMCSHISSCTYMYIIYNRYIYIYIYIDGFMGTYYIYIYMCIYIYVYIHMCNTHTTRVKS